MAQREVLVVRGRLNRAGQFLPRGCRSTPYVRQWPVVEAGDVVIELLDRDDIVLHREFASVRPDVDCKPGAPESFHVDAYVQLRDDAVLVRLRRGDFVLWDRAIGDPAHLEVSLEKRNRDRAVLGLAYSEPGDGAHMLVVYQWGARRFDPVYLGPPTEELVVAMTDLPGGNRCRFVVTYSDGLRSASGLTEPFEVKLRGPRIRIVRPEVEVNLVADTPVIFEGAVTDRERLGGPRPDEEVSWLVDGEQLGRGLITSVDGLSEGEHTVEMVYLGETRATDRVKVVVRAPRVQTADMWEDWNPLH
ncbi:hypothetical protein GR927_22080 [Mycolicibacterium sp. 3033]|nr:hypothetical protein [Mycolicibacterium aurantiacum]